jgi:hypothetical protein
VSLPRGDHRGDEAEQAQASSLVGSCRALPSPMWRTPLAQVICTFKQGRIADRGQGAQQFRASGRNLVIAAIAYWNSTYLAGAVEHMRRKARTG